MRIVVCGDDGVGKSSLITVLVKDRFVPHIEDVLPPLFIPRGDITVSVVDTSPQISNQKLLSAKIRQANVVWLVYSDHYTMERITLFWLPYLRSIGVNLPVILCQNKIDLSNLVDDEEHIVSAMGEFKEIEAYIKCSAKEKYNVNEAFYLCQRAILNPLAPLFDVKEGSLKPAAKAALRRVFFICDHDQTGYLTDIDLLQLQYSWFKSSLDPSEIEAIHKLLSQRQAADGSQLYVPGKGLSCDGFIVLCQAYCEQGRHETLWAILRQFHYTDTLSLDNTILRPKLDVPPRSHVELSPDGYRFLVDLFKLFDKDNDGGLSPNELERLFSPTPGLPQLWLETQFPKSTVRNENGYVTLQGWLAMWSMTVFLDHRAAISYLVQLGYDAKFGTPRMKGSLSAIRITKRLPPRNLRSKIYRSLVVKDRNVLNCFVIGARGSGKTALLSSFVNSHQTYNFPPTVTNQTVVNSVDMPGGKQCYLILQEFGKIEQANLNDPQKLENCDVLCCVYDSADPDSFGYLVNLRRRYRQLDHFPQVYAALKADLDRQQQRCNEQPDEFTAHLGLPAPLHVSAEWPASLSALFVQLVEAAQRPYSATPKIIGQEEESGLFQWVWTISGSIAAAVVALALWRR